MTPATLVIGSSYAAREAAIADTLVRGASTAVILEGLPDGRSDSPLQAALAPHQLFRIAPGCLCCTGSLTMRVTLNRVLRLRPERLFISLADASHIFQIREFLGTDSYKQILILTEDLHISS